MADLGTIRGQMILDVKSALNSYTQARQAHISTVTALHTGAGAMTASGAAIAGVGAAMVAGFMAAVDASATFERKLSYFQAVSGSTQKEYEAISAKALQLGADTIFSANQIADSFIELGKSGVSAKDIIDGIGEGVAALGAAADIPLDTAANIITSAVATFQLGAGNAVHVADALAGAANASIVDVTDLGTSLKYVGGVASGLGVPFDEVNSALAILGVNGIKGSTAGTSLRQILLGLNGTTAKAKGALKELGIITEDGANAFYNADGSAKSLSDIFQILQEKTAGMSAEQKTATMQQIFATRALPSLIALTRGGADAFTKMNAEISKTTAAEVASKRLDNLSGDVEILRGNLDTLAVSAGSGFQTFARQIVQGLTDMIQGFLDLPKGTQTTIVAIVAIVGALLVFIGLGGMFAGAVMNMIALGLQLATIFPAMVAGLSAMFGALGGVIAATWAWTVALLANPITWIVIAIIAVVAALIWFFTQTEVGKQIWSNFMSFLTDAWTNIVNTAVTVWGAITSFFTELWNGIVNGVSAFIAWVVNAFLNFTPLGLVISHWAQLVQFFSDLWNNIINGIATFVTAVITFFQQLPQNILNFLVALPGMIGYALGFVLGTIVRIFLEIGAWLATNVPIIINNVVNFFAALPGQILAFIVNLVIGIVTWFINMKDQAWAIIVGFIAGAINFFAALPGRIIAFVTQLVVGAIQWFTNMRAQVLATAGQIIAGVIGFFQQLPGKVIAFLITMVAGIVQWFNNARQQAMNIATGIVTGITGALNGLPGLVSGIFNRVVDAIKGAIGGAVKAVTNFASGLWEGFKNGLGIHSPSYIEHAMWDIMDVVTTETDSLAKHVKIMQGLGNGISRMGENMGFSTKTMDSNLESLYAQVAAARQLEQELGTGKIGTPGVDPATAAADVLANALANLQPNVNVEINNPSAEPASDSLPKSLRKATFMVGS